MRATGCNQCWYSPFTGDPHQYVWVAYNRSLPSPLRCAEIATPAKCRWRGALGIHRGRHFKVPVILVHHELRHSLRRRDAPRRQAGHGHRRAALGERGRSVGEGVLYEGVGERGGAMAQEWVYRVSPQEEWASAEATGALQGGALDTSSGFIHLSTAAQVQ